MAPTPTTQSPPSLVDPALLPPKQALQPPVGTIIYNLERIRSCIQGATGNSGFWPTAPAMVPASGAALINRNARRFGSLSLAWFTSDNIATAVAKDSATKTVAPPLFDDIAYSSSKQVSRSFF
jgi:hypothetical protein